MKAEVKDQISEGEATCFLVSIDLWNYISSLPENYMNYEVQREIVNNTYLDNLIQTVVERRHIPSMVLVAEEPNLQAEDGVINVGDFKVLDGLQRTYRLKIIADTIELAVDILSRDRTVMDLNRLALSRQFKDSLNRINSSTLILEKLLASYKNSGKNEPGELKELFARSQWFELWVNLEPRDEVNKMLILNAGHKAVKNQHQLELLFSNILPLFNKVGFEGFEVIREKETSSISYSKSRVSGQFHFSHLITSILSFNDAKPITNNVNLIQKAQSEDFDDSIFSLLINYDFIKQFIETLMLIDKRLTSTFGEIAIKWLGRETSLTGIFAAAGRYMREQRLSSESALKMLNNKISDPSDILKLDQFEQVRNSLDLAKVNIGSANKRAVFMAVDDIMNSRTKAADWRFYFNKEQ